VVFVECGGFLWVGGALSLILQCVFFLVVLSFFFELVFVLVVDCSKGWSFNTWAGTEFNTDLFSIVQAAPIIMFAFTCQVNVFSIYDELEKPVSICQHHL
jgi:amino acid permease